MIHYLLYTLGKESIKIGEFMERPVDYSFQMLNMYALMTGETVKPEKRSRILEMRESDLLGGDFVKSMYENAERR